MTKLWGIKKPSEIIKNIVLNGVFRLGSIRPGLPEENYAIIDGKVEIQRKMMRHFVSLRTTEVFSNLCPSMLIESALSYFPTHLIF